MSGIINPHDKFFKENFSQLEIIRDFLRNYLAQDIRDLLNLDQISLQKDSFIDNEYKEHFSDLLFMVPLKKGENAYIYLLFEHKSFHDSWVSLQLLRYMVRIWERDTKNSQANILLPIIPFVIYHGEQEWSVSTEFAALFPDCEELRVYLPNFQYLLYDLPRIQDEKIIGEYKLRIAIGILKNIHNPALLKEIRKLLLIYAESKRDLNAEEFLKTVLSYIIAASSNVKPEDLDKVLKSLLPYIGGENIMMTLAEYYRQEGRQEGMTLAEHYKLEGLQEGWQKGKEEGKQEGREEGRQEGRIEGQRIAIRRILDSRFGILPPDLILMIDAIENSDELDRLLTAAISANSAPDFMKNLEI